MITFKLIMQNKNKVMIIYYENIYKKYKIKIYHNYQKNKFQLIQIKDLIINKYKIILIN